MLFFVDLFLFIRNAADRLAFSKLAFLDDLDANFAKRTTAMLTDDRTNFDIEIDVLRDRLKRENLHNEG